MRLRRTTEAEVGSDASVGTKTQKILGTESEQRADEIIGRVIAGPETAARLGVPVGSVVNAFHIIQPRPVTIVDPQLAQRLGVPVGSVVEQDAIEQQITDTEAQAIRKSWGWED